MGLALLGLLVAGCRDDDGEDGSDDGPTVELTTGADGGSTTGDVYVPGEEATDLCALAPVIGAGRYTGTLRGKASELGGACGLGGPDAFFRLDVPRRSDVRLQAYGVGFVPRVGALPYTCTTDWTYRTLACTEGVGTWLLDVAAGSSLVIAVGVDEEDPALDLPLPLEGPDPLELRLDVELRDVLEVGDPCLPAGIGRCGTGTACLPEPPTQDEPEPEAEPGPAVCTTLPGDTCQSALALALTTGVTTLEIDPLAPQTDAHVHSCGGARRRDRVWRLQLPQGGPHVVEIRADRAEVGLAVRAPGCAPEDERGCRDPVDRALGGLTVELGGPEAFLFVELPSEPSESGGGGADDGGSDSGSTGSSGTGGDEPGEEAPIVVEVELLEPDGSG